MWTRQNKMKAILEASVEKMQANPGELKSILENQEEVMVMIRATEDRTRESAVTAWHRSLSHRGPTIETMEGP
jgi:hypothetical protein